MNYIKALLDHNFEKDSDEVVLTLLKAIKLEKKSKGSVFFWNLYLHDSLKRSNLANVEKLYEKYKADKIVKEIHAHVEVMKIFHPSKSFETQELA